MPSAILLSKAERDRLADDIDQEYADTKAAWGLWLAGVPKWVKMYRGWVGTKTDPWPGCSNISIPVTAIATEKIHSMLLRVGTPDDGRLVAALPQEFADIESAQEVEDFMNWAMLGEMKGPQRFDRAAHRTAMVGQCGSLIYWKRNRKRIRTNHTVPKSEVGTDAGPAEIAAFHFGETVRSVTQLDSWTAMVDYRDLGRDREAKIEIMRDVDRFDPSHDEIEYEVDGVDSSIDCPYIDIPNPEDLLYSPDGKTPEEASVHFYSLWMTLYEIESNLDSGEWDLPRKVRMELRKQRKNQDTADSSALHEGTRPTTEAEDTVKVTSAIHRHRFHVQKVFMQRSLPGEDFEREIIVTSLIDANGNRHILRVDHLGVIFPMGIRPIAFSQYKFTDIGAPMAIGVPEDIKALQAEINTIHNQRVDRDSIITNPWILYGRGSNLSTQVHRLRPGEAVPIGDASQVKLPTFAQSTASDFNTELQLLDFVEKMAPTSDAELGRIPGGRQTAYGIAQAAQKGYETYGKYVGRFAMYLTDVTRIAASLYAAFMPPAREFRVTGEKQLTMIRRDSLRQGYDFRIEANALSQNPSLNSQLIVMVYQLLQASPLVMQNPTRLWHLTEMLLKSLQQRKHVIPIIGERPEDDANPPLSPQQEHLMMMGGVARLPRPDDNHEDHLTQHAMQRAEWVLDPSMAYAVRLLDRHTESTERLMTSQRRESARAMMGAPPAEVGGRMDGMDTGSLPLANSQAATYDSGMAAAGVM